MRLARESVYSTSFFVNWSFWGVVLMMPQKRQEREKRRDPCV
jgi:hypothetical protein